MEEKAALPIALTDAAVVTQLSTHEYGANIHRDWSYGPAANGGYMTTLIWKAIDLHYRTTLARYNQPHTITLHVEFLRIGVLGDVKIHIKDVRLGKGSSTLHISLQQDGTERVVAYATNVNRSKLKGITLPSTFSPQPTFKPIDFKAVLNDTDANWIQFRTPFYPTYWAKFVTNIIYAIEREVTTPQNTFAAWITLTQPGAKWTTEMLPIALDNFVPPPENHFDDNIASMHRLSRRAKQIAAQGHPESKEQLDVRTPRFYVTANMSIDVKRPLPEEGVAWLFTRMTTDEVADGRLDVHGQVWDPEGRLVALAQYVWYVVDRAKESFARAGHDEGDLKGRSKI